MYVVIEYISAQIDSYVFPFRFYLNNCCDSCAIIEGTPHKLFININAATSGINM